jgi:hypothetical protein
MQSLLPATGESAYPGRRIRTETETFHQFVDSGPALSRWQTVKTAEEVQIFLRQQVGVERTVLRAQANSRTGTITELGHWLTHQLNLSGVGLQQLANDVQHCGLATTVGAQQAHDLTALDLQAEAVEHLPACKALVQAFD